MAAARASTAWPLSQKAGRIAPYLGDDDGARAKPDRMLLSGSQARDHGALATIDGDERAGVKHERAHRAGASATSPSSASARRSSSTVSRP